MNKREVGDLAKLARKRARDAVCSVTQLTDTDEEAAAILLSVALDIIGGAGVYLNNGVSSDEEALTSALHLICNILGTEKVADAIDMAKGFAKEERGTLQ